MFPVLAKKQRELKARMMRLGVKESDWKESFVRSSGPGGQNVNKVSTCVALSHASTGLSVKCQKTRSRALNRFMARKLLLQKIEALYLGKQSEEARRIAKIRRQKKKRSRRAKKKIVEEKRRHGELKKLRQSISL